MNLLGEAEERYSYTSHFVQRWRQRIDPYANNEKLREQVDNVIKNGDKYLIDDKHYRICYNSTCIIFMQLSPLHSLAKTVYERNESTLSAV